MRALAIVGLVLLVVFAALWLSREKIADNVIAAQLERMGLPATYRIERIGGTRQVLADIRVGNSQHPDLVIERAEVEILYPLGFPRIGSVKLVRPRLYGRVLNGRVSFGSLDKVLFPPATRPQEPFRLPDLVLELVDGRARILTDFGPVGIKAEGGGHLRNGFTALLAAAAPQMRTSDCVAMRTSVFGKLAIRSEQGHFSGPLRVPGLRCEEQGITLDHAVAQLDISTDRTFKAWSGDAKVRSRQVSVGGIAAHSLALDSKASWKDGALNARIVGDIGGLQNSAVAIALLGVEGRFRAREGFTRLEFQGTADGRGVAQGAGLDHSLATAQNATANTLLGPMIGQVRLALRQERPGSRLFADFTWRKTGDSQSLVIPSARLRGGSGDTLLSLSRFQLSSPSAAKGNDKAASQNNRAGEVPLVSGNFSTGGPGLPRLVGRMERDASARAVFRVSMAPFVAGGGSLAMPTLSVVQNRDGSLAFAGEAQLSGALPGGSARNLILPLDGTFSSGSGLALFRGCVTPRFDQLALANLVISKRAVTLCPPAGRAIVQSDGKGLRIAAGATALDLSGQLGATPIRLKTGPVGFAWPGTFAARSLDVELGPVETATRFRLNDLSAELGNDVAGTFTGADVQLFSVPLDIIGAQGNWRYASDKLSISGGQFTLLDRSDPDRFHPLVARDAALTLFANRIDASAIMREPSTDREVVETAIHHDLGSGTGHANLLVRQLTFDKALQPDRITPLALGVVANVAGDVRGKGSVDWDLRGVRSSGAFTTDSLDFAAAFGPVKGLSGTVQFSDLLGLVTRPGQRLRVASINPGIEVLDGEVEFALLPNYLMRVNGGRWPFLGGTLTLRPVDLNLGRAETRRYVLAIDGLDAGQFVQHMDLENISATGTFDGELPLVFDSFGGRVEGGLLTSRPPGGNVAYVGALTYKDLSAMANFAFDALKSLDYRHMTIAMDGALEGEIVTRVRFDGVRQGAGAKRNFVTRAVGNLPLQFNINVRAPFYRLITSVKAMYDPAFIEDPRVLGLVDSKGRPLNGHGTGKPARATPVKPPIATPPTATPPIAAGGGVQP